jgi:DMSO/TMAO reductase YedYZ heme-binding membrane subunit
MATPSRSLPDASGNRPFIILLYGGVLVVGLLLGLVPWQQHGWGETAAQLFARQTARFSVLLFLLVFVARPVATLWRTPATRGLLMRRRQLGLAFALAHAIHFVALLAFLRFRGTSFEAGDAPALLAYVIIALMAVTSSNAAVRLLGRWWKRLHRVGIWYVFLIFLAAYGGRVVAGPEEAVPGATPPGAYGAHVAIVVALLGGALLRLAARLRPRPPPGPRQP